MQRKNHPLAIGTIVNVVWDERGPARITDHEDGRYEVAYLPSARGNGTEWLIPCPPDSSNPADGDFVVAA